MKGLHTRPRGKLLIFSLCSLIILTVLYLIPHSHTEDLKPVVASSSLSSSAKIPSLSSGSDSSKALSPGAKLSEEDVETSDEIPLSSPKKSSLDDDTPVAKGGAPLSEPNSSSPKKSSIHDTVPAKFAGHAADAANKDGDRHKYKIVSAVPGASPTSLTEAEASDDDTYLEKGLHSDEIIDNLESGFDTTQESADSGKSNAKVKSTKLNSADAPDIADASHDSQSFSKESLEDNSYLEEILDELPSTVDSATKDKLIKSLNEAAAEENSAGTGSKLTDKSSEKSLKSEKSSSNSGKKSSKIPSNLGKVSDNRVLGKEEAANKAETEPFEPLSDRESKKVDFGNSGQSADAGERKDDNLSW
ncbi:hypothetical protein CANARDRAFT_53999 [[Candida] arabinofermentans NRRL YB-2248]|uniref:Uncharacterized protein n=1 Tax=[Candida] arabinofermentans NRRL YB-2248 TaxID=983967 RepID=A0A1E4T895_9ASCO|nr:hypothetical protein CANARDRAFT_53999 [[Candida] arabinofermentans NRRL YB-2248]